MKRAALYARVSTNNGHQNPEMQLAELREYCHRRGWEIADEYVDQMSGSRESRPSLDRLRSDCRRRLVDAIVVYRYDRFARSLRQLVNALEEFRSLGSSSSRSMKGWTPRRRTAGLCSGSSPASRSSSGNSSETGSSPVWQQHAPAASAWDTRGALSIAIE